VRRAVSPPIRPGAQPRLRDRWCPPRRDAPRRRLPRDGNPNQDRTSGKAAGVVPVDSLEGPTVKLANGDVRRIDDPEDALEIRNGVEAILDLGEYLVNYGEFVENNHPLAPASYTYEWWIQDLAAAGADVQALEDDPNRPRVPRRRGSAGVGPSSTTRRFIPSTPSSGTTSRSTPFGRSPRPSRTDGSRATPTVTTACSFSSTRSPSGKRSRRSSSSTASARTRTLEIDGWRPFVRTLGCEPRRAVADGSALESESGTDAQEPTVDLERTWSDDDLSERARTWGHETEGDNAIEAVNEVAPFRVRERAPTRIGNRMGRPEKSESRDLSPAVHPVPRSARPAARSATSPTPPNTPRRCRTPRRRRRPDRSPAL